MIRNVLLLTKYKCSAPECTEVDKNKGLIYEQAIIHLKACKFAQHFCSFVGCEFKGYQDEVDEHKKVCRLRFEYCE